MRGTRTAWGRTGVVVIGASAILAGCSGQVQEAAPAFTPVVSVNELMVNWIDNASHVLWDVEHAEFAPKDDADWTEVEDHATQVAAAGSLIQLGGTGQADPGWVTQIGWQSNAQAMTTAALAIRDAAKRRDLGAVTKANSDLVDSCEGCHKQFKPELPSEGIAHQRPHSESHKNR